MTHEEIQAELSAFALDALDSRERGEIEAHLAGGCAACQRKLAQWREVVGMMALAGADAAAPDLKPALLQRLRPPGRAEVVPPRRRATAAAWLRAAVPLAAAATLLLVVGVVRETRMRSQIEAQRQVVADLRSELTTTQAQLHGLEQELAAREQDLTALRAALAAAHESLAIVQGPGLQLVRLTQTPTAQPAEAHALLNVASGRALFYAFDLPPPPEGQAYELWWITEKEGPVNAGVFQPDPRGFGRVDARLPAAAGAIQAAAVTIEPAGGRPKPTGPMVLLGKL